MYHVIERNYDNQQLALIMLRQQLNTLTVAVSTNAKTLINVRDMVLEDKIDKQIADNIFNQN